MTKWESKPGPHSPLHNEQLSIDDRRRWLLMTTLLHYNLGNRSTGTSISGACLFHHDVHGGCAIGRHVDDEKLRRSLDEFGIDDTFTPMQRLPHYLTVLGSQFLLAIQLLHDYAGYWTKTGPSAKGIRAAKGIEKQFKLQPINQ